MTEGLQQNVLNNYDILKKHESEYGYSLDECLKTDRIAEFDELLTIPINKGKTLTDFYKRASGTGRIQNIKVPTLLVHSLDDPVCIPEGIPF